MRAQDQVTLKGTGFVENMQVTVKAIPVTDLKLISESQISFRVPALPISTFENAPLEIKRGDNQSISTVVALVPTAKVLSVSPTRAREGELITVTGQHLNLIRVVQFGDRKVAPTIASDGRSMTLTVPSGAPNGAVNARDEYGYSYVLATDFTVQPMLAKNIRIDTVDFGQTHLRPGSESFMTIPGKPMMVRAKISADIPGAAETVKLTVTYMDGETQAYDMHGPVQLPLTSAPRAANDLDQFHTFVVPGEQVRQGMELIVEASAHSQVVRYALSPQVAPRTRIHVELVPIGLSNGQFGNTDKLLNDDALKRKLQAMFPISEVNVTLGEKLNVLSFPDGVRTENALRQFMIFRKQNLGPNHHIMGILPGKGEWVDGGTKLMTGLAEPSGKASVVWDNAYAVVEDAAHELGHNLGRPHPEKDPNFPNVPRKNGIGKHWGIDLTSKPFTLYDPARYYALMSYGNPDDFDSIGDPKWISIYTYDHIAEYAAANLRASAAEPTYAPNNLSRATPVISIAGLISNGEVSVTYAPSARGQINVAPAREADAASGSGHHIEVTFANGITTAYPLKLRELAHKKAAPTYLFSLVIPSSGDIARVRVRQGATIVNAKPNAQ
ncbi:hypothetical protein WM23_15140 [Burkholderia ubonensis]|nr:hypothetical protein WM23_15140 [Burkholderia ubonensis]